MKPQILIALVLGLIPNLGLAQSNTHGGDPCEERFQEISRQLRDFAQGDSMKQLKFRLGDSSQSFQEKVFQRLVPYVNLDPRSTVTMSCTSRPVFADGEEKTCVWKQIGSKIRIDCNFNRFFYGTPNPDSLHPVDPKTLEPFQTKQVIHEWVSIAKLENNTRGISDYFYTDQINNTGGWVPHFQIGIQPQPETPAPGRYPDIFYKIKTGTFGSLSYNVCGLHIEKDGGYLVATFVENPLAKPRGYCMVQGKTVSVEYGRESKDGPIVFTGQDGDLAFILRVLDDGNFIYRLYSWSKKSYGDPIKFIHL